jgi:VanZ family protein
MVWLGLIAIESTDMLSSEHTSRFLYPLLHFLTGVDLVRFATWHFYIRKGGHFVGYFCLSVLMFRAWRATVPRLNRLWSIPWAALGFVATALVASLDEWHQSFIPSRTGTYKDVVLDSSAALFAQIVIRVVALFGLRLP